MRQGLIAQWNRRMAANGALGVALLAIPVVVAATIGLGGAGGLSSLAAGPSEGSLGQSSAERVRSGQRLEELVEALPTVGERPSDVTDESASSPGAVAPGTLPGPGGGGGEPGGVAPVSVGELGSGGPAPVSGVGDGPLVAPVGDGPAPAPPQGVDLGSTIPTGISSSSNLITALLASLSGGGSGPGQ